MAVKFVEGYDAMKQMDGGTKCVSSLPFDILAARQNFFRFSKICFSRTILLVVIT